MLLLGKIFLQKTGETVSFLTGFFSMRNGKNPVKMEKILYMTNGKKFGTFSQKKCKYLELEWLRL
jgi:hypothetical protein